MSLIFDKYKYEVTSMRIFGGESKNLREMERNVKI